MPAAKLSSILLESMMHWVFDAVRIPDRLLPLILLFLMHPRLLTITMPSLLLAISLSSISRYYSPSMTKMPSDFEFSM